MLILLAGPDPFESGKTIHVPLSQLVQVVVARLHDATHQFNGTLFGIARTD